VVRDPVFFRWTGAIIYSIVRMMRKALKALINKLNIMVILFHFNRFTMLQLVYEIIYEKTSANELI